MIAVYRRTWTQHAIYYLAITPLEWLIAPLNWLKLQFGLLDTSLAPKGHVFALDPLLDSFCSLGEALDSEGFSAAALRALDPDCPENTMDATRAITVIAHTQVKAQHFMDELATLRGKLVTVTR